MKRMTAFAAAALLLTSCSSGSTSGSAAVRPDGGSEVTGAQEEAATPMKASQMKYKESRVALPEDFGGMQLLYEHGGVRLLYSTKDGGMAMQLYDGDMAPTGQIKLDVPEDSRSDYPTDHISCALPDGGIAMLDMYTIYDGDYSDREKYLSEGTAEFVLRVYSEDGKLISCKELDDTDEFYTFGDDFISGLTPYGDNYILSMRDSYVLLSPEGEVLDMVNSDEHWYFCTDTEGRTVAAGTEGWGYMDGTALRFPQSPKPYGEWLRTYGVPFTGCGEYKSFITLNEGFYGVDSEDRLTELMDFTDSMFVPQFVYMAVSAGENRFVVLTQDNTRSSGLSFTLLTQRPEGYTEADKKTIRIGCIEWDNNAGETVAMFSKQSENYKAETKKYKEYDDLKYDVLTGDIPELFCYQPSSVMYKFARLGAFADLYGYLDSREGLSRDDIMPNILRAYEYKGGLYGFPIAYHINCWIADREIVPREYSNWNLEEFFSFAENMPEGMYLGSRNSPFMWPEQCFDSLFPVAMTSFVDFDNYTCSFDSPEFIHFLNFCRDVKMPGETYEWDSMSESEKEQAYDEARYSILNKTSMLTWCSISHPEEYLTHSMNYGLFLNDRFNYVIFPNEERSGTISPLNCMCYSILNGCAEPDGAWEYLCYINSEDYFDEYLQVENSFAANRHITEKRLENAFDWADSLVYNDEGGYVPPQANLADGTETHTYRIPDGTRRYLRDFLSTFDKVADQDTVIYDIANEEAGKFFAGEAAAEDCAAMIQNRVSLYLSENS